MPHTTTSATSPTGRSRGFGFVTFATPEETQQAIAAMNDQDLDGRPVRVNLAQERAPRQDFGAPRQDYAPRY